MFSYAVVCEVCEQERNNCVLHSLNETFGTLLTDYSVVAMMSATCLSGMDDERPEDALDSGSRRVGHHQTYHMEVVNVCGTLSRGKGLKY